MARTAEQYRKESDEWLQVYRSVSQAMWNARDSGDEALASKWQELRRHAFKRWSYRDSRARELEKQAS